MSPRINTYHVCLRVLKYYVVRAKARSTCFLCHMSARKSTYKHVLRVGTYTCPLARRTCLLRHVTQTLWARKSTYKHVLRVGTYTCSKARRKCLLRHVTYCRHCRHGATYSSVHCNKPYGNLYVSCIIEYLYCTTATIIAQTTVLRVTTVRVLSSMCSGALLYWRHIPRAYTHV